MADKKPDRIKNAAVAETIKIKGHKKRWIEKRTIDIYMYRYIFELFSYNLKNFCLAVPPFIMIN